MDAQAEARKLGGEAVGTEHLLLASCMQSDGVQASLERAGVTASALRLVMNPKANKLPGFDQLFAARARDELLPFARDTERAFQSSLEKTKSGSIIGSRELVLSFLSDDAEDAGMCLRAADRYVTL